MVFLSRAPLLLQHGYQASQLLIAVCPQQSDLTQQEIATPQEKAVAIGRLSLSYGIGMTIGPIVGGFISELYGQSVAALVAASITFLNFVVSSQLSSHHQPIVCDEMPKERTIFSLATYRAVLSLPGVGKLLLFKMALAFPGALFMTNLAPISHLLFDAGPTQLGYLQSALGLTLAVTQGLIVGVLVARVHPRILSLGAIFALMALYVTLPFATEFNRFLAVLVLLVAVGAAIGLIVTGELSNRSEGDTGAVLGFDMATGALLRTIAPSLGGVLLAFGGVTVLSVVGFTVNSIVFAATLAFNISLFHAKKD
jgi:predicted MFS family arabinose efflux permease